MLIQIDLDTVLKIHAANYAGIAELDVHIEALKAKYELFQNIPVGCDVFGDYCDALEGVE